MINKKKVIFLICLLASLLCTTQLLAAQEAASVDFTSEEKAWLAKHHIVRARVGQGEYRTKLLGECPFCPITLVTDDRLLIASHIKPWIKSDNKEKTSFINCLSALPNETIFRI